MTEVPHPAAPGPRAVLGLRARLLLGFAAMAALTVALGLIAFLTFGQAGQSVAAIFDRALIATSYARNAAAGFAGLEAALARRDVGADAEARAREAERFATLAARVLEDIGIARERATSETVVRAADAAEAAVRAWLGADPAGALGFAEAAAERLDLLAEHVAGDAFRQRQQARAAIEAAARFTGFATLAALLVAALAALLLGRRIIGPVAAASRAAEGIAAGRLDTAIPPGGRDELGALLRAMARMRDAIRATIEGEKSQRRSAEGQLADALQGASEGVVLTDGAGRIRVANARARALLPEAAVALAPGGDWAVARAAASRGFLAPVAPFEDSAATPVAELPRQDGAWLRVARSRARDGGAVVILSDVTERHAQDAALQEANRRFATALDSMVQGLALFDREDRLLVINARALELLGLRPEDAPAGLPWEALLRRLLAAARHPGPEAAALLQDRLRFAARRAPGTRLRETPDGRFLALSIAPSADGGFVTTWQDVTERERAQARIAHLARHDALTGLPNRALLRERLAAMLSEGRPFTLHVIDLDRFREVNDSWGMPAGDRILQAVGERLQALAGLDGLAARLSGDDFALIQPDGGPAAAAALGAAIAARLGEPHDLDGAPLVVRPHLGHAIAPADGATPDLLMRHADIAATRARAEADGAPLRFHPDMDQALRSRRSLEVELRRALIEEQLELHYQPLVETQRGRVVGFEALLRWQHPARGRISPAEFVPVAEQSGLIVPIGEWALRRAALDARGWPGAVRVAVNVSPLQFRSPELVRAVLGALEASGLPATRLEVEITESTLLDDAEAVLAVLRRLREAGVRAAMDDFGTGYSSLATLRAFPFDKIKIDQSFVRVPAEGAAQAEAIVRAVTGLAAALGMRSTAEGVETHEQFLRLRAAGCTEVQGYLFSRPVANAEVPAVIERIEREARAAA